MAEEMRELKSHHFATTNVIIDSDKNHQTMEWKVFRKQYTHSLKLSTDRFSCHKEEKVTL